MSDKEIIKELKSIEDVLASRLNGLLKKFGKKLKSKEYNHNDVLDVGEYLINDNKVLVCFQRMVFTDKLADLGISIMVLTEDNEAFFPSVSERESLTFLHITNHTIQRMWERMGLTIKDFFVNEFVMKADTALHLTKYEGYGYDDSTYIAAIGRCFFIVHKDDNKIVFKTVLDWNNLYTNQMRLYIDSKKSADKYADKMYYEMADSLKESGVKKTSDLIKKCA